MRWPQRVILWLATGLLVALLATTALAQTATDTEPQTDTPAEQPLLVEEPPQAETPQAAISVPVKPDEEMEDVKKALVKLKRDLVVLEEDLLFPASSQVSVFLSMDIGKFFQLDAVTLKLNGKEVAHHLYTEKQVDALHRGGVQKLFVGNVKQGNNRVTAFFTGLGPNGRDFRRATTVEFEKGFEPTFIELAISDETEDYQPDFISAVSN
ncbi:MAG: AraC family transcriptional regulator [Pseudomonadota bacterium]